MKLLKSLILCVAGVMMLTSCNDWLDVNTSPNNPSSESATYQSRLSHIEFYTNYAQQIGAWRSCMACGDWTRYYNGSTYWNMSIKYPTISIVTTPYQWWFVGAACNIESMREKAEAAGAWHYVGVADLIWAYGSMLMTDLYGEMPFDEACGESATPTYNTGKEIYLGCFEYIDRAIENLSKSQEAGCAPLSEGDHWANGDASKWLKFAYLLKARWINKLNKKAAGSYKEGKYDVTALEECLNKAQQSTADDIIIHHIDGDGSHDNLGWDEPVVYTPLFSVCGMNAGYMPTNTLYQNLVNFAGLGIEDPRADKIIPWQISSKSENSPAEIKFTGKWRRSLGVEMVDPEKSPYLGAGPLRSNYGKTSSTRSKAGSWWIDHDAEARQGDTVYVECTSDCKAYYGLPDIIYQRNTSEINSQESGSFYYRVSSPTWVATYAEACFIRAEMLMKKGDANGAKEAVKKGVRASIDQMNAKLGEWLNEDAQFQDIPSFTKMEEADITKFINAFDNIKDFGMAHILTQKRVSLMISMEIWNDMRRYDYDPKIFLNYGEPIGHQYNSSALEAIPEGKQFRRWRQCSHEYNYNTVNLQEIGHKVPGANMSFVDKSTGFNCWNMALDCWTIPVWWDSDQE